MNVSTDLKIIRMKDVEALTSLKRSTIYKKLKTDKSFPKPFSLSDSNSPGAPIGFLLAEVLAWIESRIAMRNHN
jgi:prophage regulatory protein